MQMRGQLARLLHDRDAEDAPLSPHWEGVEAEDEDLADELPDDLLGLPLHEARAL